MRHTIWICAFVVACSSTPSTPTDAGATDAATDVVIPTSTSLAIDGDPNGLYWDATSSTLYVADDGNNRILTYTDAGGSRAVCKSSRGARERTWARSAHSASRRVAARHAIRLRHDGRRRSSDAEFARAARRARSFRISIRRSVASVSRARTTERSSTRTSRKMEPVTSARSRRSRSRASRPTSSPGLQKPVGVLVIGPDVLHGRSRHERAPTSTP